MSRGNSFEVGDYVRVYGPVHWDSPHDQDFWVFGYGNESQDKWKILSISQYGGMGVELILNTHMNSEHYGRQARIHYKQARRWRDE